jgi:hypothetical protein
MRLPRCASLVLIFVATGCDSEPPAPELNYPPVIVNAIPQEGDIFTPGAGGDREVAATLSDQNLQDHLYVRHLVDYPSSDFNATHLLREIELPPSGLATRATVRIQPDCAFLDLPPGQHRLVMSVSDRPYLDPAKGEDVSSEAPFDSVPDGANRIRVLWLLHCP